MIYFIYPKEKYKNMWKLKSKIKPENLVYGIHNFNRLALLLTYIKAGNNSYKLKNEIKQILYLLH